MSCVRIVINPTKVESDPVTSKFLNQFLKLYAANNINEFLARQRHFIYALDEDAQKKVFYSIEFTHTVVSTQRTSVQEPGFSVISNRYLGQGNFGSVYEVEGILTYRKSGRMRYKENKSMSGKRRAAKIQKLTQWTRNEAFISQAAPHLGAKAMTIVDATNPDANTYLIMHLFEGQSLAQLLHNDSIGIRKLTIYERLLLSKNILRALEQQLHQLDIIHCDIKPENIIVDTNTLEVFFIDLGLARNANDAKNIKLRGTRLNWPPEAINPSSTVCPLDKKFDIFTAALTLGKIWNATGRSSDEWQKEQSTKIPNSFEELFPQVFSNIDNLSEELKSQITALLRQMTMSRPGDRPFAPAVEFFFEAMIFDYKIQNTEPQNQSDLNNTHNITLPAYKHLSGLKETTGEITKYFLMIQTLISDLFLQIGDSSTALNEFIDTIEIRAFKGLTNKKEIKDRIAETQENLSKKIGEFQALQKSAADFLVSLNQTVSENSFAKINNELNKIDLIEFIDDTMRVLHKCHHYFFDFDEVFNLVKRLEIKYSDFQARFNYIKNDIDNSFIPSSSVSQNDSTITISASDANNNNIPALPTTFYIGMDTSSYSRDILFSNFSQDNLPVSPSEFAKKGSYIESSQDSHSSLEDSSSSVTQTEYMTSEASNVNNQAKQGPYFSAASDEETTLRNG